MNTTTTRHAVRSLFSRVSVLLAITALAFVFSVLATTPAHAAPLTNCPSDRPCIDDGYQTGHTITIDWQALYRYDGYNVLWSRPGVSSQQFHIDHDDFTTTLNNIYPYTSYTFSVQGCNTHLFSSSTCTPWSNSFTVSTAGSSADVCLRGFVWREARPGDYVCVTPDVRDLAAYDNSQANARRNPNGAYGPNTCIQGYIWRAAFTNDAVCVTPQTHDQVAYDNSQAIYRVVH